MDPDKLGPWSQRPRALATEKSRNAHAKPLISVEEAAQLLGQSRSTLYRAIGNSSLPLPVLKIGGRYRIARVAVERLIDGQTPSIQTS
jgi:excisionase family DNA binding protein